MAELGFHKEKKTYFPSPNDLGLLLPEGSQALVSSNLEFS
jgi:hypothetical protein